MNGDVVARLLHQSVANREAGMVRGDGGVHTAYLQQPFIHFVYGVQSLKLKLQRYVL